jgi:cytochrome c oxidase subunit IV
MSTDVSAESGSHAHGGGGHAEGHSSVAGYIWIGVILAVVTFVEVAVFYIEALEAVEVPILVILSTAKVILVVLYFMHLKMDHKALTWLFMAGVVLAVFMVSALLVLYHVLPRVALTP